MDERIHVTISVKFTQLDTRGSISHGSSEEWRKRWHPARHKNDTPRSFAASRAGGGFRARPSIERERERVVVRVDIVVGRTAMSSMEQMRHASNPLSSLVLSRSAQVENNFGPTVVSSRFQMSSVAPDGFYLPMSLPPSPP